MRLLYGGILKYKNVELLHTEGKVKKGRGI